MAQLVLVYPQVSLVLTVRKVGLRTLSTKELVNLAEDIGIMTQSIITKAGYSARLRVIADGVMISTNA